MKKNKLVIIIFALLVATAGIYLLQPDSAHQEEGYEEEGQHHDEGEEHGHEEGGEHRHEEAGHDESESAEITAEAAKNAGLVIEEVKPVTINQTISLSGKITLNQNKTALVKARFPGIIRSVKKAQGDVVKSGETLATIESNESLQVYSVTSPLAGTILSRNGNIGDTADDEPIFTISDINELWVELHVFAQDAGQIKPGQKITISSSECEDVQETAILSILPVTEASSQTLLARAVVKNLDSHWLPGMSAQGQAVTASNDTKLAVKTSAIQRMEGNQVVFVQEGDEYHARIVETGASDDDWTEIKSGVKGGEKYVSDGSFTVKAEIGKSEAEHSH